MGGWIHGWVSGWMDGCMEFIPRLRFTFRCDLARYKFDLYCCVYCMDGWMDEWMVERTDRHSFMQMTYIAPSKVTYSEVLRTKVYGDKRKFSDACKRCTKNLYSSRRNHGGVKKCYSMCLPDKQLDGRTDLILELRNANRNRYRKL